MAQGDSDAGRRATIGIVLVAALLACGAWLLLRQPAAEGESTRSDPASPEEPTTAAGSDASVHVSLPVDAGLAAVGSILVAPIAPSPPMGEGDPQPIVVTGAEPVAEATGDLAVERTILREAQHALVEGDGAAALAGLEDHRARFPTGALARDRDVTRVAALCVLERGDEARRLANELDATSSDPAVVRALARCDAQP